jgi:hypothetical protein
MFMKEVARETSNQINIGAARAQNTFKCTKISKYSEQYTQVATKELPTTKMAQYWHAVCVWGGQSS